MKRITLLGCLLLNIIATPLFSLPAQIIIIRHAEKDSLGNLSQRGWERAGALAPYLTKSSFLLNFGLPTAIFAARPTPNIFPYEVDENTLRCVQTVSPTAQFLNLPIHSGYAKFQEEILAQLILNNPNYDDKNILICWHHGRIPELAIALGASSAPTFPYVFDQTWVITYSPSTDLIIYQQALLFGDAP